ncbi:MarR family winged helix-turn-helix transcriptional regulator [Paenarthrobacter sp. Z7-10]|uniref:MarR family winged helix-turn-helix transcriptional regulator n=1 Tax=Paenarthrobacter sp. Z7-10 TaxID=2787635 RepID=UPI002E77052A|nr:MarR family transcriptional regulator [Paenarthrobacter sp. Z7-10]
MTHAGVAVLDVLTVKGAMTQSALAGTVRVKAQTMGRTLVRLESHGHISRTCGLSDRRSHVVSITPAGSAALVEAHELEALVFSVVKVDPDILHRELLTLVRGLGGRDVSPVSTAIVAGGDGGF